MGGSSKQTVGYKYYSSFLLFIGNPIEKLLNINFDKRGWIADERISYKSNGEMIYIEKPNLYGENEGGVYGTMRVKHGTNNQTVSVQYKKYMASLGLPASAYPYQSYVVFGGGGFPQGAYGLTPEELESVGDDLETNSRWYGDGFYLGNSGYMKEMLLWPKRTRIRNDGRRQWYEVRGDGAIVCEIKAYVPSEVDEAPRIDDEFLDAKMTSSFANSPLTIFTHIVPVENNTLVLKFSTGMAGGELPDDIYSYCIQEITSSITGKVDYWEFSGFIAYAGEVSLSVGYSVISRSQGDGITTDHISGFTDSVNQQIQMSVRGYRESQGRSIHTVSGELILRPKLRSLNDIECMDINPIHKIREILTDDTAMNKPESDVNDLNFMKAADRIWDEGLGISWAITEKSCMDAINELCSHIEAGIRVNRQTGLYEMVLFRDDWFDEEEIQTLPANKIKSMNLDGATSVDELINKLNVSYYNRDAIKNSSFSIAENAAIRNLKGHENSEDVKFPYFMNQRNAAVVAQWKLKQISTPVWQGTFTTGFYEARKWNRYDLLKLAWPKRWNGTILVRIMKINLGTGAEVSIDFVEVVPYSNMLSSNIVIDTPVDTTPKPPQPAMFKAFELSYLEAVQLNGQKAVDEALAYNPDAGYAAVIAQRPQSNSLNALMYTDIGNDFERAGAIVYSETAELNQNISQINTTFIVKNAGEIDMVSIGTQITVNNEIMVYQSYDEETGLLTVKRGALDTVPQNHLAGSILYFADDFITVDPTEYVTGEIINVKALTTTPSGILGLDDTEAQQVEIQARAIRPYPPANVKFNDAYYPETLVVTNNIVLVWVDRNRVQQTGGSILGFYEAGVTIEAGVTYSYELISDGVVLDSGANITANTITIPSSALLQNQPHTLKLWSVRDGYASYQIFEHAFFVESASLILTATATKSQVSGNTVPAANISVNVDESLKANMQSDGSKITVKTQAGATITIEVEE